LLALSRIYEQRTAGRTGKASRDVLVDLEALLAEAGCAEGDARALAERQLIEAEILGLIERVPLHRRDRSHIHQIRFSPAKERAFYDYLEQPSPSAQREALAAQFTSAIHQEVLPRWQTAWREWCVRMAKDSRSGGATVPFDRTATAANEELLSLLAKLLRWEGESMVRFASCVLCGDSKKLESLSSLEREGERTGQLQGKLGRLLSEITDGQITSLDDLGIIATPRSVLLHGPLIVMSASGILDLGLLQGPFRLSAVDLDRCTGITTSATRCLTVENETTFCELAKLDSGVLLICTSYPGSDTVKLLKLLPTSLEFWHFGDSDTAGFDILRVLREKSGKDFQSFLMQEGRIPCEQESLGRPQSKAWPFYSAALRAPAPSVET